MENMSTMLKPDEISFGVLFFWHKLRQYRTFLKLLPFYHWTRTMGHYFDFYGNGSKLSPKVVGFFFLKETVKTQGLFCIRL